ncbi:MAG: methyltransferase [Hungatella sp.]
MVNETWNAIMEDREVRQNLSKLRQELKASGGRAALLSQMAGEEGRLIALLGHEDAKVRKNAALLMGDLGSPEFLAPIYEAYREEEQMFVKSFYLTALENFDCRIYLGELKERLQLLSATEAEIENQKHQMEELRKLSALVILMEGTTTHKFIGWGEDYHIILLTNRNFPEITEAELRSLQPKAQTQIFGVGIKAQVKGLMGITGIRTWQELLFVVKGMENCPMDAEKASDVIARSELLKFLGKSHEGKPPYYFRIEFKSKMDADKRMLFAKKLAMQIEKKTDRKLINTTSNYEIEIRLIENKEGSCNILLKLQTMEDGRFTYRKEVIPVSIRPVTAALTVALTKKYMKEDAQVLDPFCGVGTMLVERHKAVRANTCYGIDLLEDAIEKAKKNTEEAHQTIHYINRNFFDFRHEYLFDEIITDLPFRIGRKTEEEIYELYVKFFQKSGSYLKPDGMLILYTHNLEYIRELAHSGGYRMIKEYEISKKEGTYVVVCSRLATTARL